MPSASSDPAILDAAVGDLVLQICEANRNGQTLPVRSPKCSVGSDPACTLRLRGPGICPAHCLIVRGTRGTEARRWAPDTRLNGGEFLDAPLVPGDQLALGPMEMEVLETGAVPLGPDRAADGQAAGASPDRADRGCRPAPVTESEERTCSAPRPELEPGAGEREALEAALAAKEALLRARDVEIESRSEDLRRQQRELDDARRALDAQRRAFEERQDAWQREREATLPAGPERPGPADPWEAVEPLKRARAGIFNLSQALPSPESPVPPAHDGTDDAPESRPPQCDTKPVSDDAEHEEAVDQYMTRLLQRVRSPRGDGPAAAAASRPPAAVADDQRTEEPGERLPAQQAAIVPVSRPAEYVPRAVAPEKTVDLSAMRELANLSAKAAIERHARSRLVRASGSKLFVALFAAGAGGLSFWMTWFFGLGNEAIFGGTVCLATAGVWGLQYLILTGRIIWRRPAYSARTCDTGRARRGSDRPQAPPEPDAVSSTPDMRFAADEPAASGTAS